MSQSIVAQIDFQFPVTGRVGNLHRDLADGHRPIAEQVLHIPRGDFALDRADDGQIFFLGFQDAFLRPVAADLLIQVHQLRIERALGIAGLLDAAIDRLPHFFGRLPVVLDLDDLLRQLVVLQLHQQLTCFHRGAMIDFDLLHFAVRLEKHIATNHRFQRAAGFELELFRDQEQSQQRGQDQAGHGQRLGQVARGDQPTRLADRAPQRHQKQAVVFLALPRARALC